MAKKAPAKKARRKRTRGKTGAGPANAQPVAGNQTARVRMYRQGLGDCFLVTLPLTQGPFRILIDCGVFLGSPSEKATMKRVAADIVAETGGVLDLLVATHEHYDHLIGFKHAAEEFQGLTVRQVWLAWTEDETDSVAAELRKIEDKLKRALQLALMQLRAAPAGRPMATKVEAVMAFGGEPLAANYSVQMGEIMEGLRIRGEKPAAFLRPGPPVKVLDRELGIGAYILGPPRDVKKVKAMNDPGGETYEARLSLARAQGFAEGVLAAAGVSGGDDDPAQPFEAFRRIPETGAGHHAFFKTRYLENPEEAWRRIDTDWLQTAETLAIQLNSYTNNSSLVFALELGEEGPVLLFAADAQVGNWLSWHDHAWEVSQNGGGTRSVTAEDLLSRTVLYKVGHHGSHNATLREKGLELMTSPELVAMIPTDEAWALEKKGWEMPYGDLATRLKEKTRGRVLRVDAGVPEAKEIDATARTEFLARVRETELYVECDISVKS